VLPEGKMKRIVTLLVGLALLLPAGAIAQGSSTCQAYNPQLCGVSGVSGARSGPPAPYSGDAGATNWLPFTGLDLVLLVAAGGGLLAAGLLVRRLSHLN
jgi:hypothetical protein